MESHCLSDVCALLADCYDLRTQLAQILHRTVDEHVKPIALDEMHPAMVAVTAKLELHVSESDELRRELTKLCCNFEQLNLFNHHCLLKFVLSEVHLLPTP